MMSQWGLIIVYGYISKKGVFIEKHILIKNKQLNGFALKI